MRANRLTSTVLGLLTLSLGLTTHYLAPWTLGLIASFGSNDTLGLTSHNPLLPVQKDVTSRYKSVLKDLCGTGGVPGSYNLLDMSL